MSRMSELSQALDEMVACGEGLIRAANEIRNYLSEGTETEPPAKEEAADAPCGNQYSFTDVRRAFSAKSHAGYTEQVKALITRYGADKLSAIKEEDFPAIMADLEAIV